LKKKESIKKKPETVDVYAWGLNKNGELSLGIKTLSNN
jgi:alpha-tubulin suppressor-like RCC1 family protein